jgi:hypothetical protein
MTEAPEAGSGTDVRDPVFVLCAARSGSTLLRFLLDAHPDLACPPETMIGGMCAQMAAVWATLEQAGTPGLAAVPAPPAGTWPEPVLAGIRRAVDDMAGSYLRRRGKRRFCDKSLSAAVHADLMVALYPAARFICLYRHPMDLIASGVEACPWGLGGFGFDQYAMNSPGNSVHALAQFWVDNTAAITSVAQRYPDRCAQVRYEDVVADPELVAGTIFEFLGLPPAPGVSRACFAAEREFIGPSDYKIWQTAQVSAASVGRGWSVPAQLIGPPVLAWVNHLAGTLGYVPVDERWGAAPAPPDLRLPGSGPAAVGAAGRGQHFPSGYRLLRERLQAAPGRATDEFTQRWAPCSTEVFLVTATPPGGTGQSARWRADLSAGTVTMVSVLRAAAPARWDIAGPADVWEQVLDGRLDLGVAVRRRLLRYADSGGAVPALSRLRLSMLADLLLIRNAVPPATAVPPGSAALPAAP